MATVEAYLKSIVCSTCLSRNRRFVRDNLLIDVKVLFPKYLKLNPETDRICWECHAMLVKLMQFHRQAMAARQTLNEILIQKKGVLKSLSNLELRKITGISINPHPTPSNTGLPNKNTITVRNLSPLTIVKKEILTDVNFGMLELSSYPEDSDAESHLTKFAIKNIKENINCECNDNIVKTETHESVNDIIRKDFGKENVECSYIPILDMRHISIKNIKNKEFRKSGSKESFDETLTESEQPLGDIDNTVLDDHSYYDSSKQLTTMKKHKKNANTKKKMRILLKDIRIYNNVIEVDISETELQELRSKEMDSECFVAAKFKCEKCIFGYQEESLYKAHLNKHKESYGPYECRVCKQRFQDEDTFNLHYSNHYRAFSCAVCKFSSRFLQTVVAKCRASGCSPPCPSLSDTTCSECDFQFADASQLTWHRRNAHKGHIKCRYCGKQCPSKKSRNNHESRHADSTPVECQQCHKTVLGARGMYMHMRYTHANEEDTIYCSPCKKFFKNTICFVAHLRTSIRHATSKFQCDYCGKSVCSKMNLVQHIAQVHLRLRRHACELCDKKYPRKSLLRAHIRAAHSGIVPVKKHMCSECGKAYTTISVLRNHSLTHAGVKPHQCPHCPWRFTQKSTLSTHIKYKHRDVAKANQPPDTA